MVLALYWVPRKKKNMDNRIREFERLVEAEYGNTAGIVVLKNSEMAYEGYLNNCTAASPVHVFSVTKSIVSLLVGIAIDKGHIRSTNQRVIEFFPDYTPKRGEKTLQQVTLENLLTMTAPYKYKSAPYTKYFTSESWVKSALDLLGGRGDIGQFRYTPLIGPDIITGILANATGEPVGNFAAEHLFGPLGISPKGNIIFADKEEQLAFNKTRGLNGWVADPQGVNTAGWGLTLTAMEMAKIGQMCLDGGCYRGQQIVSADWIVQSTKEHSRWPEMDLSYGYLWWAGMPGGYAAMGDCGNVIYINPANGLVVAIASLLNYRAKDRIELIEQHIIPTFG